MESIRTLDGKIVPVGIPGQANQWSYKSFYVTDVFGPAQHCHRCTKEITYCYVVSHPTAGESVVGSECIRTVLSDGAMKSAMHEFHSASCKISQARYRNRVTRLKQKLPKGILEALTLQTKRGPVQVKSLLNHLESKLALKVFLSQFELELIQRIESKL